VKLAAEFPKKKIWNFYKSWVWLEKLNIVIK
jgi:hypothetical protein